MVPEMWANRQREKQTETPIAILRPPNTLGKKDILVKIYLPRMKVIAGFAVPVQALIDYRSDLSNTVLLRRCCTPGRPSLCCTTGRAYTHHMTMTPTSSRFSREYKRRRCTCVVQRTSCIYEHSPVSLSSRRACCI